MKARAARAHPRAGAVVGAARDGAVRRRPGPLRRRRVRRQPIVPNPPYDGQFTFVRLRYGPPIALRVAADSVVARLPDGEQHFMKILNELTYLRPHDRGDQHPGARRSRAVQVSGGLHGRARLLDADRRGGGGVPRLPAQGRLRHLRRLRRAARRLGRLRGADPAGAARGAVRRPRRDPPDLPFVLRDRRRSISLPQHYDPSAGRSSAASSRTTTRPSG